MIERERVWTSLSPKYFANIEFKNLIYKVSQGKKDEKVILNGVSGRFKSGELTAIIGPSGAGKTTLLNVLAGYKYRESSGAILINGQQKNAVKFAKISRYIMQECFFAQGFTVQETMTFAANLKLGDESVVTIAKTVNEILLKLRLEDTKQTPVSKLSGGEKKRVSIALELINNPSILFLDEPTTGLDYYSSYQCIHLLRDLANTGRTIVCSLHAPTAQMLSIFDNIYVVASGQCVYQGKSNKIVEYLTKQNLVCPTHYDPIDFITEICNDDYGDYKDNLVSAISNGSKYVDDSEHGDTISSTFVKYNENSLGHLFKHESSWWRQFKILSKRMWLQALRNKILFLLKFGTILAAGLSLGLVYQNKGTDGSHTFHICGCLMASIIFVIYFYAIITLFLFSWEWKCLRREYFNKWYSLSAYYSASFVSRLPFHITFEIIYVLLFYILIDFPLELKRFTIIVVIHILAGLVGESLAELCATAFKLLHALMIYLAVLSFSNASLLQEMSYMVELPEWVKIILALNYEWYAYKGATSILFDGRKRLSCSGLCFYPDLDEFLKKFGTGHVVWQIDVVALIIALFLFKIIAYFVLRKRMIRLSTSIRS